MTRCLAILLFLSVVWPNADMGLAQTETASERLSALVFQYLDTEDSDKAERLFHAIQQHSDTSIERVIRIIETERTYESMPIGTLPDERLRVQGHTYQLALSIPLTY